MTDDAAPKSASELAMERVGLELLILAPNLRFDNVA